RGQHRCRGLRVRGRALLDPLLPDTHPQPIRHLLPDLWNGIDHQVPMNRRRPIRSVAMLTGLLLLAAAGCDTTSQATTPSTEHNSSTSSSATSQITTTTTVVDRSTIQPRPP